MNTLPEALINAIYVEIVRIDQCIHLECAALVHDAAPEALEELYSELDSDDFSRIFPDLNPYDFLDDGDAGYFAYQLADAGKKGWLIQVHSPVREYFSEDSYSHSWGYARLKWIYADTYLQALGKAVAWAKRMAKKDLAKFKNESVTK